MTATLTRAQAADFLADLLDDCVKSEGLFEEKKDRRPEKKPEWVSQGLVLAVVEHHCRHCGAVHMHTSPKVLLKESLVAENGTVLKSNTTLFPKAGIHGNEVIGPLASNVSFETIRGEDTDFCLDCIHEMSDTDVHQLFIKQQARIEEERAGVRLERLAAIERAVKNGKATATDALKAKSELDSLLED